MDKPDLQYRIRAVKDPTDRTKTIYVPVIVERGTPVSLTKIITRAINEGRLLGIKTEAAESLAKGILAQIKLALEEGEGVNFGDYFRVRLYLDGTVETTGSALSALRNRVNIRLAPGTEFRSTLSSFSWHNVDAASNVTIYNVQTVGGSTPNLLAADSPFAVYGSNLDMYTGDTLTASWDDDGETQTLALNASEHDNAHIKVSWPSGFSEIESGTEIAFTLKNHPDGLDRPEVETRHVAVVE